jgi:hypothetical protein
VGLGTMDRAATWLEVLFPDLTPDPILAETVTNETTLALKPGSRGR